MNLITKWCTIRWEVLCLKLLKNKNEYIKKIVICLCLTISLGGSVFITKGRYDDNKNIKEEVLEIQTKQIININYY